MELREVLRASGGVDFLRRRSFDAIVVGTGAAGGVAARQLTEAGLSVLALEAGYGPGARSWHPSAWFARFSGAVSSNTAFRSLPPSAIDLGHKALKAIGRLRQPVQTKCFAWTLAPDALVDDRDCPYEAPQEAPFHWFRSRQIGGRMFVPGHGRQYYRYGVGDMVHPAGGLASWPIDPAELNPWYAAVERRLGLRGGNDRSSLVPDSTLSVVNQVLPSEAAMLAALRRNLPDVQPILGRFAPPVDWMSDAAASGRLTLRTGAVVRRVHISAAGQTEGVEWFDCETGTVCSAEAPIVFLCASAFESTRIMLCSRSTRAKEQIGMHSAALGRFAMDHGIVSCSGYTDSVVDDGGAVPEDGRCIYVPFTVETPGAKGDGSGHTSCGMQLHRHVFGKRRARIDIVGFLPMEPRAENRVALTSTLDRFGMPTLRIDCRYSPRDRAVGEANVNMIDKVRRALHLSSEQFSAELAAPGTAIHECGTARMGSDPANSVVDPHNECWDAKGLFVTDAAAFPSLGAANPTLTIMALSARAAAYAVTQHVQKAATRRAGAAG